MKLIFLGSFLLSCVYSSMTHPTTFMLIILAQTLLVCLATWSVIKTGWFSFIIFLIFLGGLMVLFIYITSLASNETIYSLSLADQKSLILVASSAMLITLTSNFEEHFSISVNLNKMFYFMLNSNFCIVTVFSMFYLLFALIVVVKIANQFEAPLKNIF